MKKEKNILVITYWPYNSGILNSYTLPYVRLIKKNISQKSKLFLFTLTPAGTDTHENFEKVKESFAQEGITLINHNYKPFGVAMLFRFTFIFLHLIYLTFRQKIDYIHCWCTPGGAIGYFISIFTGKKLVLDSFEPHAESMVETKTWKPGSFAFRILFALEKRQLKRASEVICTTSGMIAYSQKSYGITKNHYFVKPACVDLQLFKRKEKDFSLVPELGHDSLVCVYVGKFGDIYLDKEVFDFFKVASDYWGDKFKVLLLTNHSQEEINRFCDHSKLNRSVVIRRFVKHTDVPAYMSLGDFGICPVRPVPTKQFCTPIKNGEYWAMGLPVIITKNISDDSKIIGDNNIGHVLEALTENEYLLAVKKINTLINDSPLKEKIRVIGETYRNYKIADDIYKKIYGGLIGQK